MGFFSFKCSKSNLSIPAYPDAGLPVAASHVVLVTPQNERIEGIYNGYGRVGDVDVYAKCALFMFGQEDRDLIWSGPLRIFKGKKLVTSTSKSMWDSPLRSEDFVDGDPRAFSDLIGLTLNEVRQDGHIMRSNFDEAQKLIKIVRADHYNGESYDELKTSKRCPEQGFFYERATARKIMLSLLSLAKKA